jgi:uncharacterized protein (DUF58 family)
MIAPVWFPLLGLVILLGALFDLPWVVTLAVTLLVVLLLAWWWNRYALRNIHYRRRWHYRRGFPGERFDLRIEVENRKPLPVSWLRVRDAWPNAVGPEDADILAPTHIPGQGTLVNLYSLRWFQRSVRAYTLLMRKRGYYPVGPYDLESGDILGIFQSERRVEHNEYITVFPELIPFKALRLPTDDPFGDQRARRRRFEDPTQVMGVRDYHPEDDFRRVHWPATARAGALQVKQYQHISAQVMVVCLNVTTTAHNWLGTAPHLLEYLVKICATLVYKGVQDGYAVGLFSNGCLAHSDQPFRIPPGRSRKQLGSLLQALAGVTSFTTGSFEWVLSRALPQLPYGSTLIVVTAFVTPQLAETLIRLRQYRPNLTVLTLEGSEISAIPGVRVVQVPAPSAEGTA